MPTNLLTRYATLSLSIIVMLTVANCAVPAEEDSKGVVPWSSSSPVPDSGFPTPLPEPTGPLASGGTNPGPGGSPPPNGGTNPGPGGNPPPNGGTNPGPGGNPPPEPTEPLPGGNTNPVGRTVTVAGPTPDNRYQESSWNAFTSSGQEKCTSITNSGQVDVRITRVRITDQQPPSSTVFRVFSPLECAGGLESVGSCLNDPTLPPYEEGRGPACLIGIVTDAQLGTEDYTAKLVYELETVCTTTTLSPCNDPKVRDRAPSPSAPVRVNWQHIESILACFEKRPDQTRLDPNNPGSDLKYPNYPYYDEEVAGPPDGPHCPPRTGT